MKIEITGDPGTGNTFQEYNIQHVDNFNPKATTVVNNYYDGNKQAAQVATNKVTDKKDTEPVRTEILDYVRKIKPCLADDWKNKYDKLWNDILSLSAVVNDVYKPGKQQNTNFNRNLVAHLIYYIGQQGVVPDYHASHLAVLLEGDRDHPVRSALGKAPGDEIVSQVKRLLKEYAY